MLKHQCSGYINSCCCEFIIPHATPCYTMLHQSRGDEVHQKQFCLQMFSFAWFPLFQRRVVGLLNVRFVSSFLECTEASCNNCDINPSNILFSSKDNVFHSSTMHRLRPICTFFPCAAAKFFFCCSTTTSKPSVLHYFSNGSNLLSVTRNLSQTAFANCYPKSALCDAV